jgi:hypothetical protein
MSTIASKFSRQPSEGRIANERNRHQPVTPEQMPFADAAWPVWRAIRLART